MSASLSTKSGVSNSDDGGIKPVPCRTEILFRVWTDGTQHKKLASPGEASGEPSGIVAFLEDVVASRQGALLPTEENMYVSILENASQALVVARQVQLGMQDFQKKSRIQPIAVSIAIDASASGAQSTKGDAGTVSQDAPRISPTPCAEASHDLLTLIRMSRPSQILLTHELFQKANLFRGLPLKTFQGRFGVFEYLWTAEEKLLELEGDPTRFRDPEPGSGNRSERPEVSALASRVASDESVRMAFEPAYLEKKNAEAKPFWRSPLGISSAAASLLVVLIAGGIALRVRGTKADPPIAPVIQNPTPVLKDSSSHPNIIPSSHPTVHLPAPVEKPRKTSQVTQPKTKDTPKTDNAVSSAENTNAQSAPAKTCSLAGSLDGYLSQAEYARGHGDYTSAERLFTRVLECDPNNETASRGLSRTRAAKK
jgi:hypothetical protein